jgi:hypothetical protein
MKSKLGNLKDGQRFYRTKRKKVEYTLQTFEGSMAVFTATISGLTYRRPKKTVVFLVS